MNIFFFPEIQIDINIFQSSIDLYFMILWMIFSEMLQVAWIIDYANDTNTFTSQCERKQGT